MKTVIIESRNKTAVMSTIKALIEYIDTCKIVQCNVDAVNFKANYLEVAHNIIVDEVRNNIDMLFVTNSWYSGYNDGICTLDDIKQLDEYVTNTVEDVVLIQLVGDADKVDDKFMDAFMESTLKASMIAIQDNFEDTLTEVKDFINYGI